jgi:hypothetical protein
MVVDKKWNTLGKHYVCYNLIIGYMAQIIKYNNIKQDYS